jgi:hypothetical protein
MSLLANINAFGSPFLISTFSESTNVLSCAELVSISSSNRLGA